MKQRIASDLPSVIGMGCAVVLYFAPALFLAWVIIKLMQHFEVI